MQDRGLVRGTDLSEERKKRLGTIMQHDTVHNEEGQRGKERGTVRAHTLRAMCEASRGRQLRLIRAETDSGRSDGYLIL